MPLTIPTHRRPQIPGAPRRGAGAHPGPQPRVDQLQQERSRRHADRGLRLPDREPALPQQPDSRAQPAQVPDAARRPAAAAPRRRAGSSPSRTSAARSQTITLDAGLEVRAGQVPFRTELGLDVLPVEAQVFYKRRLEKPPAQVRDYYEQLYASYAAGRRRRDIQLYQTVPLTARESDGG